MLERCKDYGRVVVECCFFVSMVLEWSGHWSEVRSRRFDEICQEGSRESLKSDRI